MIYDFGSPDIVLKHLIKTLPTGAIMKISKSRKLEKFAKVGDLVIFYGWGAGHRKCQRGLLDKGIKLELDGETSLKIGNKIGHLKEADKVSKYLLERVYIENKENELREYRVPKLKNSALVVVKIGNSHQGIGKYLKKPHDVVRSKENIIYEQYVESSRSLRVLIIGAKVWVVEHLSEEWIKNTNPKEVVYQYAERYNLGIEEIDGIIEDALNVANHFNMDYAGIDYVVNDNVIGLLEVNDMIGLPDDDIEIDKASQEYWLKICENHLGLI